MRRTGWRPCHRRCPRACRRRCAIARQRALPRGGSTRRGPAVRFDAPVRAVTPGQSLVLYDGEAASGAR
ncbi:MAG: aminomethyltransferase beta-barrel domain-containing protein [Halofilum sp. (in: g-proteobacteria)]|nr:aminomethyltransferase beta-barrel domain-containing protein [Halofilum sp. (in: g-proteobacteria)]